MRHPNTWPDLIDLWPSAADFSRDIGAPPDSGRAMRRRGAVNVRHWAKIVRAAEARGINGITLELLAEIGAGRMMPGKGEHLVNGGLSQ